MCRVWAVVEPCLRWETVIDLCMCAWVCACVNETTTVPMHCSVCVATQLREMWKFLYSPAKVPLILPIVRETASSG